MSLSFDLPAMILSRKGLSPLSEGDGNRGLFSSLAKSVRKHIIVLSRELTYYTESEVALTRHRDIKAYVRSNTPLLCPFSGWRAVYVAHSLTGTSQTPRTRLQIWFYDPVLINEHSISSTRLLLPEEWLLATATRAPTLYSIKNTLGYWLYAADYSLKGSHFFDTQSIALKNDEFTEITQATVIELDQAGKTELLKQSLRKLRPGHISGFTQLPNSFTPPPASELKRWAAYTAVAITIWLGSGSALLIHERNQLENVQAELAAPLRGIIADNQQEQELQQQLKQLVPLFTDTPRPSQLWPQLSELPLQDTRLSRFMLTGDQLVLAGQTESASTLLATLSQLSWVQDAEFTTPVSRQGDLERFRLKISIKHPLQSDSTEVGEPET